jgi:hypothetical protein
MRSCQWLKWLRMLGMKPVAPSAHRTGRKRSTALQMETLENRLTPAAPKILSIGRLAGTPHQTNASSVTFSIAFDQPVTGVDVSDFKVIDKGMRFQVNPAFVLTGSGANYSATIDGIVGDGELRLGLIDDDTIVGTTNSLPLNGVGKSGGYTNQATHSTANTTTSVIATDVNGDGRVDLVYAAKTGDHLNVLIGLGDGGFLFRQSVFVPGSLWNVEAADVNRDGVIDLVGTTGSTSLLLLLGNGNGTFRPAQPLSVGAGVSPMRVTIADFNGDTFKDLAYSEALPAGTNLWLMLGNGDGTFQSGAVIANPAVGNFVESADFDGDGAMDLAYTSDTSTFSVMLGNGDGTFALPQAVGVANGGAAIADLNRDGALDIVTTNSRTFTNGFDAVFLGNGDGTFRPARTNAVGMGPNSVAVGDINGDGNPDLATTNGASNSVSLLLGNGDGTFHPSNALGVGLSPYSIAAADFDRDGLADVAIANHGSIFSSVFNSKRVYFTGFDVQIDQTAPVAAIVQTPPAVSDRDSATFNYYGTDSPTNWVISSGLNRTEYRLNDGNFTTGMFNATFNNLANGPHTFQVRSIDNAGNVSTPVSYTWTVAVVAPVTTITAKPFSPSNATSPTFAFATSSPVALDHSEYSLDGGPFITATSPVTLANLAEGNHTIQVRGIGAGGEVGAAVSYSWIIDVTPPIVAFTATPPASTTSTSANFRFTASDPVSGGVSSTYSIYDFRLDGGPAAFATNPLDFINLAPGDHTIVVRAKDDPGNFGSATYSWTVLPIVAPHVLSIDRLVPAGAFATGVSVDFAVSFSEPVAGVDASDFQVVGNVPFAAPIVVSGSGASYTVTVTRAGAGGNGTLGLNLVDDGSIRDLDGYPLSAPAAAFANQATYPAGGDPRAMASADFNGDGTLDLVVGSYQGSYLGVLIGNGDGTFRPAATVTTGYQVRALTAADFNGDGNTDIVVSDGIRVYFFLGNGNGTFKVPFGDFGFGGGGALNFETGDVNGDGKLDVVALTQNSAALYLSNADGTFKPRSTFRPQGTIIADAAFADINGDFNLDLVLSNQAAGSAGVFLGSGGGGFQPEVTYAAPGPVNSVALGDLNGDGKPDLVVASEAPDAIGIRLGNGDGTFRPATMLSAGGAPTKVAVADINLDGNLDIAFLNSRANVFLGNGNGTFQPLATFAVGSNPVALIAADFSGDGRPDLAVANQGSGNLSVLLALKGDLAGQAYSVDSTAPTATINAAPALLTNSTLATFTVAGADPFVGGVSSGVNHLEYQLDSGNFLNAVNPVALTNLSEGVHTFRVRAVDNVGNIGPSVSYSWSIDRTAPVASFVKLPPSLTFASASFSYAAVDPLGGGVSSGINHLEYRLDDGPFITSSADVALTNLSSSNHTISIRAIDNAGNAGAPVSYSWLVDAVPGSVQSIVRSVPTGPATNAASVAFTVTFNKLMTGVDADDFALVLSGVTTTAPLVVTPVPGPNGNVFTVTVNGIAGGGTLGLNLIDNGTIRDAVGNPLAPNNAPASFLAPQTHAAGAFPSGVTVEDVNGDGKADLLVANPSSNSVSVLLGNGNGTFQAARDVATDVRSQTIAIGDVNGDGKADLVIGNDSATGAVSLLLGNGDGNFQPPTALAVGSVAYAAVVADLNGDGKADVAAANKMDNSVSVLLGNGDGAFKPQATFAVGGRPLALAAADVNGDGKPDLIAANSTGNAISVLLGNGDGAFQAQQSFATGAGPRSIAVGDVDVDGVVDLAVANADGDSVSILRGLGNGAFAAQQTFASTATPLSVSLANLNGDRKPDLAVANLNGQVSVLLGNGTGAFQAQKTFAAGAVPVAVAAADVSGDGRADLTVANAVDGRVSVLLNAQGGSFTGPAYTIDRMAPTVVITPDGATLTSSPTTFTFTFSEAVADFFATSIALTNGTAGAFTAVNGTTYTLVVTPATNGAAAVSVPVGAARDALGNGNTSASAAVTYNVPSSATTTALAASPNATTGGTLVTFTAIVSPSPGNFGTVNFKDNGAPLPGGSNIALAGGVAIFTTSTLPSGSHPITAEFSGAVGFSPSQSAPVSVLIAPAPTLVSVTPNANIATLEGPQRSRVASLVVVFDQPVQLDAGALTLALHQNNVRFDGVAQPTGYGAVPAALNVATADNITWIVIFAGNTDDGADGFNSLKDGVYDFKVDAAKVHPQGIAAISMAASSTTTFHRLFGDTSPPATPAGGAPGVDFQAIVNTGDNLAFRGAFNSAATYKAFFDFTGDGVINSGDNLQFRNRFNKGLTWRA